MTEPIFQDYDFKSKDHRFSPENDPMFENLMEDINSSPKPNPILEKNDPNLLSAENQNQLEELKNMEEPSVLSDTFYQILGDSSTNYQDITKPMPPHENNPNYIQNPYSLITTKNDLFALPFLLASRFYFFYLSLTLCFGIIMFLPCLYEAQSERGWFKIIKIENMSLFGQYWHCYGYVDDKMLFRKSRFPSPETFNERWVSNILDGYPIFIYMAFILYGINRLLEEREKMQKADLKEFDEKKYKDFCNKWKMSHDLQTRVIRYFESEKDNKSLMSLLPSELQSEIKQTAALKTMDQNTFFSIFSQQTQEKIALILEEVVLPPFSKILPSTHNEDYLFLIKNGAVQVAFNEKPIILKMENDILGEYEFLTETISKFELETIYQTTIYSLRKSEFLEILKQNNQDFFHFCAIRDSIKNYHDFSSLKTKCKICKDPKHHEYVCPKMHFNFNIDLIKLIKKSINHIERKKYKRNSKKTRYCFFGKGKENEIINKNISPSISSNFQKINFVEENHYGLQNRKNFNFVNEHYDDYDVLSISHNLPEFNLMKKNHDGLNEIQVDKIMNIRNFEYFPYNNFNEVKH